MICDGKICIHPNPHTISIITSESHALDNTFLFSGLFTNDVSSLCSVPCGHCPVFNLCNENMYVTPDSCHYLDIWTVF